MKINLYEIFIFLFCRTIFIWLLYTLRALHILAEPFRKQEIFISFWKRVWAGVSWSKNRDFRHFPLSGQFLNIVSCLAVAQFSSYTYYVYIDNSEMWLSDHLLSFPHPICMNLICFALLACFRHCYLKFWAWKMAAIN